MPIYLRNMPGAKRGGDLAGPYEEGKLEQLRTYAQNLSQSTGKNVDAFWVCGRRRPMLLFSFRNGKQSYPRTKQEERQLQNVASCLGRPGAATKSSERTPQRVTTSMFSSARKLPGRFACPARIVSSEPLQDFSMPRPVQHVGGEQRLDADLLPPIPLPYGPGAATGPFSPRPLPFGPESYDED